MTLLFSEFYLLFYYSTMFSCHFDPGWYPFDDQTCKVVIGMDRDFTYVKYNAVGIRFTGKFCMNICT